MTLDPKAGTTDKLCASCHNVGNKLAGGSAEERGPNLWLAPDRLRPEWLRQWITAPNRLLPFTGMPKNFLPGPARYQEGFAGRQTEQIIAVRDALMNYHSVQQRELASQQATQPTSGGP